MLASPTIRVNFAPQAMTQMPKGAVQGRRCSAKEPKKTKQIFAAKNGFKSQDMHQKKRGSFLALPQAEDTDDNMSVSTAAEST